MMSGMRWLGMIIMVVGSLGLAAGAHATSLKAVPLDEMVTRADLIFIGKPVSKTTGTLKGPLGTLTVDTWTFQVSEVLKVKGTFKDSVKVGGTFSWKQARHGNSYTIGGDLEYFLHLVDVGDGFLSPVGLHQGSFEITTNPDGTRSVHNRLNNQLLFRGSKLKAASMAKGARSAMESGGGPIPLDDFKQLVESLKGSQ